MGALDLALSITSANGTVTRWGPDEPDGRNLPSGLTFSTSIPGGFKDMTVSLPRDLRTDQPDQRLFDDVRVYGPGNQTAWEGRMAQFPAAIDDKVNIQPAAIGWAAHLKDDPSFREIYVDRDLSRWTGPSVARQLLLSTNSIDVEGPSVSPDATTGAPSLAMQVSDTWSRAHRCEALYDAAGLSIGSLYYAWQKNASLPSSGGNWSWLASLWTDDLTSATGTYTSPLQAAGPGSNTLAAVDTRKFAVLLLLNTTAGGTAGVKNLLAWTCLAVYGTHGLTKQGTASATAAQGFYASDVVANIVSRAAPLLIYTTGDGGSIQATSFVIEQLTFPTPTTGEDALSTVNAFHLWEWGVWENREFFFRKPTDELVWEARLSEGARIQLEGDDAANIYNGVIVQYTDPSGQAKIVGPTGASANDTSASLLDTSDANPINAHGIPRKWGVLQLSNPATLAGATQMGAVWLAEHSRPSRRGSITFAATATHPSEGPVPSWRVRAGDYVRVSDNPSDVPRRIIETRYDHDARTLTASVDNTNFRLDSILERLGVSLGQVI